MSLRDFFHFKTSEYTIVNPDKTDIFYYGKYNKHHNPAYTDISEAKIFNNPYIVETTMKALMKQISHRSRNVVFISFLFSVLLSGIFFSIRFIYPDISSWIYLLFLFPIIFILFYIFVNRFSGIFMLRYSLAGKKDDFYQEATHHLSHLIYADNLWHVNNVVPNRNPKDYGGVKQIYHRCRVKITKTRPFFIESNIPVYSINFGSTSLYFLPDCILVRQRRSFAYYLYSDLFLYYTEKPSLEKNDPPKDAPVIGHKWLHPNKDGSKDKRYKSNPQIPLLLFSELLIYFKGGFQTYFQISNMRIAFAFFTFLSKYAEVAHKQNYQKKKAVNKPFHMNENPKTEDTENKTENRESFRHSSQKEKNTNNNSTESKQRYVDKGVIKAFRILGLLPGTKLENVKRNYRLLVKRYHPDLYDRRNELMKKFAENRIREINKAYDHIVKWASLS